MSDNIRQALKRLHDWALVMAGGCKFSGDHPIAQAAAALGQPKPLCPLCGYPHGHAIGCRNNPVDIALRELNAPAPFTQSVNGLTVGEKPEPSADARDAARYRWLTDDHADYETRQQAEAIAVAMTIRGKGHTDAAIDAAMAKGDSK